MREKENSSLDVNLSTLIYNFSPIAKVLQENPIKTLFFTSRFVEKEYKKHFKDLVVNFPHIELIALPSPSPRYASMRKSEKVIKYAQLLPQL